MENSVVIMDTSRHEREKVKYILNSLNMNKILEIADTNQFRQSADLIDNPSLVIMDLALPHEYEGFEVLEQMRRMEPTADVPVIITTRSENPKLKSESLKYDVSDYIQKPYEMKRLVSSIKSIISPKKQFHYSTSGLGSIQMSFEDFFDREIRIADRNKTPLSVILVTSALIDADQNRVPLPSEILEEFYFNPERTGSGLLRSSDAVFFNTNGDAIYILPHTSKQGSTVVGDMIRKTAAHKLKNWGWNFDEIFYQITVTFPEDGHDFQSLMEAAFKKISDRQLLDRITSIPIDIRKYARKRYNQLNSWF